MQVFAYSLNERCELSYIRKNQMNENVHLYKCLTNSHLKYIKVVFMEKLWLNQ